MAASAEHDCHIRKEKPIMIVSGKIINEVSYKIVALAGHHEADREARWVSGWSDKVEAS